MRRAIFFGMAGQDHQAGGWRDDDPTSTAPQVDTDLLAEVARATGAPPQIVEAATETAHRPPLLRGLRAEGVIEPLRELCSRAAANCRVHVAGAFDVEVHLVDFNGDSEVAHS